MKKELIEKIMSLTHPTQDIAYVGKGFLQQILEEELPDFQRIDEERFKRIYASKVCDIGLHIKEYNSTLPSPEPVNPMRIDEERMRKILNNIVGSSIYYDQLLQKSVTLEAVKIYNSTLSKAPAQPPALVPLPKEMPDVFMQGYNSLERSSWWGWLQYNYGTPDKPNLPSVEELAKEITVVFNQDSYDMMRSIAQHLHDKYSLHPREWWKDAIPYSTQFKYNDTVYTFSEYSYESSTQKTWIHNTGGGKILCSHCTPYTPPTAQEIIAKHNLSEEEVRAIREGTV